ncbi:BAAT/acyl-CoA thioester hydrolase protein [Cooperia oncophora]
MLAVRHPELVCSINGGHCLTELAKIKEHGEVLPFASTPVDMMYYVNGCMCYNKAQQFMDVTPETDVPIETAPKRTAFRFVVRLVGRFTSTRQCSLSRHLRKQLNKSGHYYSETVDFAPGGHLMEPPYFPSLPIVYSKFAGCMQSYGGLNHLTV